MTDQELRETAADMEELAALELTAAEVQIVAAFAAGVKYAGQYKEGGAA